MAHMMATGIVIQDASGIMETLRAEARENLASGPQLTRQDLAWRRYAIATTFEDATDIVERDPEMARAMLVDAVTGAARLAFLQEGRWLPGAKALLNELEALDPSLGHQVRTALRTGSTAECLALARQVVQHVVGSSGFFEWESDR
jgi:hypothetical protein